MKLVVVDLDKLKKLPIEYKRYINANKVCTLIKRDFGKKTLLKLPKNDPSVLKAAKWYQGAIFLLKDDGQEIKYENKMFRSILKKIQWFRIGVILRREKAIKILLKLLEI